MANNFNYSTTLCTVALKENIRFINASSAATYGSGEFGYNTGLEILKKLKPLNMYGYSKHLFDLWADKHSIFSKIVSLKFFNVYGPNEYHKGEMRSLVCKALPQIMKTGSVTLFASNMHDYKDGEQMRDFTYLKDCSKIVLWLLQNPQVNGLLNVGTGKAQTWNQLIQAVSKSLDKPVQIDYIALPEHLKGKYQYFTQADMSWLTEHNCPITFTSLEDGIDDYIGNYLTADCHFLQS